MTQTRYRCALIGALLAAGAMFANSQPAFAASSFKNGLQSAIDDVADSIKAGVERDMPRRDMRRLEEALRDLINVFDGRQQHHGHGHFGQGMQNMDGLKAHHHHHHHHHDAFPGQHMADGNAGRQKNNSGDKQGTGKSSQPKSTTSGDLVGKKATHNPKASQSGPAVAAKPGPRQTATSTPVAQSRPATAQPATARAAVTPQKTINNSAVTRSTAKSHLASNVGNLTGVKQAPRSSVTNVINVMPRATVKPANSRPSMPAAAKQAPSTVRKK